MSLKTLMNSSGDELVWNSNWEDLTKVTSLCLGENLVRREETRETPIMEIGARS